ncbi:PAS domain S-box protein [Coleofasciculus sp. FACHB-T130]|uniref:PAS domain S-box protein n=1 Tax=Cyanophyceae TaxID=3028117 RepID=UPI001684FC12|nr:PAS domain S-box protein [Coleofasciculus sp. FACHB-T130]MBD1880058.1 PAS domain S-box protein [Coleofasciculus sp. FACHB-T130]
MPQSHSRLLSFLQIASPAAIAIAFPLGCLVMLDWLFELPFLKNVFPQHSHSDIGLAILGVMNAVVFGILVWWNDKALKTIDSQRQQAEEELRQLNAELEVRIEQSTAQLRQANEQLASEIAERKQAEETLSHRQQESKAVLENAPDAIMRLDRQMRYVYVNSFVERSTAMPALAFIGKTPEEAGSPKELCQLWEDTLRMVFETGQEQAIEFQTVTVNGFRNFQSRVVPEFNQQGEIETALVVSRDISDLKRAEAALQKEREFLKVLLDNVEAGIVACDANGVLTLFNQASRAFHGLPEQPLPAEQWAEYYDLYLSDGKTPMKREDIPLFRALQGEHVRDVEMVIAPNSGKFRTLLASGQAFFDSQGTKLGAVVAMHDITERKRVEEALRESEERLQAIVDNSTALIYLTDTQHRILLINRRCEDLFDLNKEQTIGKSLYDIWSNAIADAFVKNNQKVLAAQIPIEIEEVAPHDDELHTYISIKFPLYDASGVVYAVCGISTDITERKQIEEHIRTLNADLEERVNERTAELRLINQALQSEISERQRAEEERAQLLLREQEARELAEASEQRYRFLAESIPQIVWTVDSDSDFDYVNQRWVDYSGLTLSQSQGDGWFSVLHPDDRLVSIQRCHQSAEAGESYEIENRFKRAADGQYRWHLTRAVPMKDPTGRIVKWFGTCTDIDDQKHTAEALRESEARLQAILDNIPAVIYLKDTEGKFIFINHQFEILFHIDGEKVKSKTDYDLFPKEMADVFRANDRKVLEARTAVEWEEVVPQDDGLHTYISTKFPLCDAAGVPYGVCGISTDITKRKRAEEALQESEARFRRIVESNMIGILFWDVSGNVTEANNAFLEMVGYTREDLLLGKVHWKKMTPVEYNYLDEKGIQELAATGICSPFEKEYIRKDGSRIPVLLGGAVLEGSQDKGVCFVIDITERKRMEEALFKQAQELARSNAELEQFAYVASHDLQEPLRMVASYTQLLSRRYKGRLDEDADDFIDFAVDGANRMQRLIQDLLEYSRLGTRSREFEMVDCDRSFEEAIANLQIAIAESNATVTHDPLPSVRGDATQLGQLLQNLIGNGIKFRKDAPPQVHVSAQTSENEWVFSVRDNGIGIAPAHQARIFVIFQRLHARETYPGNGMGLAICKKIVDRHGGRIWVDSEWGQGSVFYFTIPRTGENPR